MYILVQDILKSELSHLQRSLSYNVEDGNSYWHNTLIHVLCQNHILIWMYSRVIETTNALLKYMNKNSQMINE